MTALLLMALLAFPAQDPVPTEKDADAAVKKLKDEWGKISIDGKIAALKEAARTEHEKVAKAIGDMLVSEADPVRIAAAGALAEFDHPAAAEALSAALGPNLKREEVLNALLKAIGELGWQTPVKALNDLVPKVADPDVRAVLPPILTALGQLGSPSSVDPLIDLLLKLENGARRNPWPNEAPMRRAAEEALRTITGSDLRGVAEWESWWKKNQESFRAKLLRIYWVRKTQDRVEIAPGDKTPADAVLVATRLHANAPAGGAQGKRKKKSK